ncbi:hypothetical protein DFJ69_1397 [Thermomonospora umbrina]|uniref:Uncharacterized protein n=1 Tax=Thermomonospora umbrina TaxID=111806 RepID=A0A3D9SJ56_9ACTN|nr:hypothetical protein DFJ69_1397 [Thermomonospora umbrina]
MSTLALIAAAFVVLFTLGLLAALLALAAGDARYTGRHR